MLPNEPNDIACPSVVFLMLLLHWYFHPVFKLFKCSKQSFNSVLLSSMLKFWVLVLNYKCPKKCVCCLNGFIWDFLELPPVKSFKIFTAHSIQQEQIFNTKKVWFVKTVFSIFVKFCLLPKLAL